MIKCSKIRSGMTTALAASLTVFAAGVAAHDDNEPGTPVCLEANYMMADAQNAPFAGPVTGPGRVIEMNIITGERGITVNNPFGAGNAGTPICDNGGVSCAGPWKPTGVLSGGMNGHAFLTSAAQHAITEFHRDGTAIRTAPTLPTSPSPDGGEFGFVPRLLGSQIMPNGNLMQTVCDANFFNANNSDPFDAGENAVDPTTGIARPNNSSWMFFPPVYSTPERAANSRILVLDQESLEVIDEYSAPDDPRWSCPAGISFTSEGMLVSGFHSAAVFVIDWKAGVDNEKSEGVGSNRKDKNDDDGDDSTDTFKLDSPKNVAKVLRVIDLLNEDMDGDGVQDAADAAMGDPNRRDSLRANSLDESGNVYGTFRARSRDCLRGEAPGIGNAGACNPGVFRQHVFIAAAGSNVKTGSIALDPGVNVIAGIRINRMSALGCDFVTAEAEAGAGATGDECDVETLYVAASAANAGCDANGDGVMGPGHPANQCFKPGGSVYEYRIDNAHIDGASGSCTGSPTDGYGPGEGNEGCAMPIAQFVVKDAGGNVELVDPRMLMPIHEAFIQ